MEVFLVSNLISINSHKGKYSASFVRSGMDLLNDNPINDAIYIIDKNITKLYKKRLSNVLKTQRIIEIEAKEDNKSLDKFPGYVDLLVRLKVRRKQPLVAIGGGITQDITCFLASTVMRGLPWIFYPTTLLAQSDSCIGSKSSINSGEVKNILGTFTPPEKVVIDVDFLETIETKDVYSGLGEMIKVHAIDSPNSFNEISASYEKILSEPITMQNFIYSSLLMKKKLIEIDEFDLGPRNVMNYGHSFGHAIETATNFEIPHGIAVTIGMDIANFVSVEIGVSNVKHFERMHMVLEKNYNSYKYVDIDIELLLAALSKDKKNSATQLRLILPDHEGCIGIDLYDNNEKFKKAVYKYFSLYCMNK